MRDQLTIQFDAQALSQENKTGIGWCVYHLIRELKKQDGLSLRLNYFSKGYTQRQRENVNQFAAKNCEVCEDASMKSRIFKLLSVCLPLSYQKRFGGDADVSCFLNYYVPRKAAGKKLAVVYDMVARAYPDTMDRKTKLLLKLELKRSMRRADKILTISEFSRQEIVKYYGVASDKLMVMPMGVDANRFYPAAPSRIENAKKTYRISGEYYMYLGTLEPRKNIETLIKAYDLLKRQHKEAPKLVIAGGKGWLFESIFETVQALGLADSVLFTGYVGAEDVAPLLSGALAFVFPSIYEGFGMPVLEAMACGAPVIASNVSSIPEVAGDCAMLVTPDCAGPWAQAMWEVWQNETLRQQLRESGQKRAAQFTWERAANILLSAIKELAD